MQERNPMWGWTNRRITSLRENLIKIAEADPNDIRISVLTDALNTLAANARSTHLREVNYE